MVRPERALSHIQTSVCCVFATLTAWTPSRCRPKRRMATAFSAPSASMRGSVCGSVCVHTAAPHGHSVCLIGRADTALSASHLHSGSAECLPRSLSVSDILSHTFSFSLILYTRHFAALALLIFTFILRASNVRTSDEPRAFEPPAFESLALGCFRVKNHVKNCPHSNYQRKWPGALWAPHWLSSIQR